ncbi:MAG: hypothetical protein J6Y07_00150 [Alphaproteobacteria bacterium]|nr:hypothetical protein [Alphaproteobacteria bacterium]
MVAKKKLQNATKEVEDSLLKRIENKGQGRTLTDQEIAAVKWYVKVCLFTSPLDIKYDADVHYLIENGNIENILKKYQEFYEKGSTVVIDHRDRMHKTRVVRNELIESKR